MSAPLERVYSIDDLRVLAERRLPRPIFDYIDGGADDELSLIANRASFASQQLLPRFLSDVSAVDSSTSVLGQKIAWPVILAPTGMSRLFHHEGERAVARAAQSAGTMYGLSSMASVSIEDVARISSGPKCFQIYVFRDRGLTRELMARARESGYCALCLTVDVPVAGNRERDHRSGMTLPPRLGMMGLLAILGRPNWCYHYATGEPLVLANVVHRIKEGSTSITSLMSYVNAQFDPSVTWRDVAWMIEEWNGPFAIKGLLAADDAIRAVEVGASAVWLSNHGGRQIDTTPAAFEMLPRVVDAIGDRAEILIDGGIRRGTDVLKALALGARACAIGRSYLYGLGTAGEAGVTHALTILRREVERGMALLGVDRLSSIGSRHLVSTSLRSTRTRSQLLHELTDETISSC